MCTAPALAPTPSSPVGKPLSHLDSATPLIASNTVEPVSDVLTAAVVNADAHALPEVTCATPSPLPDWSTRNIQWHEDNDIEEQVVRRYSLSLCNRTPPRNSLAADILGTKKISLTNKSLMSSIKDMQEVLSDFNSCQSTLGDSTSSTDDLEKSETVSTSRKKRKKKGFSKFDYSRENFIKKQDTKVSPKSL